MTKHHFSFFFVRHCLKRGNGNDHNNVNDNSNYANNKILQSFQEINITFKLFYN